MIGSRGSKSSGSGESGRADLRHHEGVRVESAAGSQGPVGQGKGLGRKKWLFWGYFKRLQGFQKARPSWRSKFRLDFPQPTTGGPGGLQIGRLSFTGPSSFAGAAFPSRVFANSGCRPTRKPPFPKFISRRCSFGVSPRSEMITVAFENQTKFAMSQIFSRNRFGKGLLIGGR
ncbi:MAG: hypothetical protein R6W95_07605 [Desulfosarcina sp.]